YGERRAALEAFVTAPVELTPMVTTAQDAERWLQSAEGVIAKETAAPYRPGERVGMVKVKRVRTLDAVVLGYRPRKAEGTVGWFPMDEPGAPELPWYAVERRALFELDAGSRARLRRKVRRSLRACEGFELRRDGAYDHALELCSHPPEAGDSVWITQRLKVL